RRLLAITREITARKAAEDALRASEEQYRAIFNASADALVLWNSRFQRVDVNPAYERMYGYSREEAVCGARARDLPAEYRRRQEEIVARTLAGEPCHEEIETLRRSGERFQIEVRTIPIRHRGEPHVLAMIRDVTERKEAERRHAELEAQLRQAQKMEAIGHLTGGIAHDFNNILTSIMGYVVLSAERQARFGDPRLGKYLEQAHLSCERARDLIQQMLTFSRGRRGEPRPISLPPLVNESVKLLRSSLPATLEIQTALLEDVPAVMLDPVQLEQILLNLCINARDAMAGIGKVQIAIRHIPQADLECTACRQPARGDCVELVVEDSGPGIPAEIRDRIFEPFFSTKEVGKGSGMGLSTVHGILHEHGGHVVVETAAGGGARFRVLFPALGPGHEAVTAAGRAAPGPARATIAGRVLVVEDEEMVGEFMRDLLEGRGLAVTVLRDPAEALDTIRHRPDAFDLIITDQTMPRLTGLELAREISGLRTGLPIILYTGYGEGIEEARLAESGVCALARKPVDPQALLDLISAQLVASSLP
ncbi:MAG TPA: PAS domain S-box protein, partial [Burkholderiales bacterium]